MFFSISESQDAWKDLKYSIEEMEEMKDSVNDSLAISNLIGDDCFIAEQGKTFRGHRDMISQSVMEKIINGELNPLSNLPPERTITEYFS